MEIEIFNDYKIIQDACCHKYLPIDGLKEWLDDQDFSDEDALRDEISDYFNYEVNYKCFDHDLCNVLDYSENIEIANLSELVEHFKYLINDGEN